MAATLVRPGKESTTPWRTLATQQFVEQMEQRLARGVSAVAAPDEATGSIATDILHEAVDRLGRAKQKLFENASQSTQFGAHRARRASMVRLNAESMGNLESYYDMVTDMPDMQLQLEDDILQAVERGAAARPGRANVSCTAIPDPTSTYQDTACSPADRESHSCSTSTLGITRHISSISSADQVGSSSQQQSFDLGRLHGVNRSVSEVPRIRTPGCTPTPGAAHRAPIRRPIPGIATMSKPFLPTMVYDDAESPTSTGTLLDLGNNPRGPSSDMALVRLRSSVFYSGEVGSTSVLIRSGTAHAAARKQASRISDSGKGQPIQHMTRSDISNDSSKSEEHTSSSRSAVKVLGSLGSSILNSLTMATSMSSSATSHSAVTASMGRRKSVQEVTSRSASATAASSSELPDYGLVKATASAISLSRLRSRVDGDWGSQKRHDKGNSWEDALTLQNSGHSVTKSGHRRGLSSSEQVELPSIKERKGAESFKSGSKSNSPSPDTRAPSVMKRLAAIFGHKGARITAADNDF